jgi:RNA polymerase sigma-70 factor (ECF subfamily)
VDDTQLILASREDPAAFRLLYDRWAERLLAYFYLRVRDPEVAADLLAETFAVVYARRRRFTDTGRPGGAWLYGIARKELAHYFRRRAVDTRALRRLGVALPTLDEESIARIDQLADAARQQPALAAALGQMTPGEREAVELRVVDELEYSEIAARLGCSEGSVRTRVHRGLARLASLMEASA